MHRLITTLLIAASALAIFAPQAIAATATITEPTRVEGLPGYNQPNQYLAKRPVKLADNMEPVIDNADQTSEARRKLAALQDKTGKRPNADIEEGHKSTLLCHLGNIAYRTGHTLNIDLKSGHIIGDKDAEALWSREYRPGWEPKV